MFKVSWRDSESYLPIIYSIPVPTEILDVADVMTKK